MTTKNYDPIETGGLTPAAARRALARLKADILSDDDHPFNHPQHFQHEDFVETFRSLNAMARRGDEDAASASRAAFLAEALGDEKPCASAAPSDSARQPMFF